MSRDVLARALEAYRAESEEGEARPAETLRSILTARQKRRRLRPLLWVAMLTCSAVAVAGIRAIPHLPWRFKVVSAEQAKPAVSAPVLGAPSAGLSPAPLPPYPPPRSAGEDVGARSLVVPAATPTPAPVPTVSAARPAHASRSNRAQPGVPASPAAAAEPPAKAETPGATSFDPEDILFEEIRKAHDSVPLEEDLANWERYLSRYPDGRFAPEARYRRALALARLGRGTEALSAFLWFTEGEQGGARREDALRWVRALSQEP